MSEMPPKKKRPRVAGQPRPGASRTGSAAKRAAAPKAKRAPIERLAGGDPKAAKSTPAKSAPAKSTPAKSSPAKAAAKPIKRTSTSGGAAGVAKSASGVAKSAPRAGAGALPRGALLLGLAGLVALVIGLFGFWHPGGAGPDKSFLDSKATSEVLGQIESAACLSPKPGETFEQWKKTNYSWMTGKALEDWNKGMAVNQQIFEQTAAAGVRSDCKVRAIGVRDLTGSGDGSTAHVLVNFVTSTAGASSNDVIVSTQMEVVRQGGRWKVSKVDAYP
ncbi:hypothetical protein [Gordonia sp. (in: high G+C Gram-positive bacteria)]|uniref:hypothetical protein n=1 Tax=Gordonia sp. (in: high G+C Gram-positive bacteria) TaxID=84139 RepID=UPI0039E3979D